MSRHPSSQPKAVTEQSALKDSPDTDRGWKNLVEEFPDHPALNSDTIYALPEKFLDALKQEAPDFLALEEMRFERMLSSLVTTGFFLRRPVEKTRRLGTYLNSESSDSPRRKVTLAEANEFEERWTKSGVEFEETLAELMKIDGISAKEFKKFFQRVDREEARTLSLSEAYAGWLVTNVAFCQERDSFCHCWRKQILAIGHMPGVPRSKFVNFASLSEENRAFTISCINFYRRWNLEALQTWELPIPMRTGLIGFSDYGIQTMTGAGVLVFVPDYMLWDRSLTIYDAAETLYVLEPKPHLKEWLERNSKSWGPERFAVMYQLYVVIELALRRRYGAELRRKVGKLDLAFARYQIGTEADAVDVCKGAESVRKIRMEMQKRLRKCLHNNAQKPEDE